MQYSVNNCLLLQQRGENLVNHGEILFCGKPNSCRCVNFVDFIFVLVRDTESVVTKLNHIFRVVYLKGKESLANKIAVKFITDNSRGEV